jgi:hypothetical protein
MEFSGWANNPFSSVGDYGLLDRYLFTGKGKDLYPRHLVQSSSGFRPDSYIEWKVAFIMIKNCPESDGD